MTKINTFNDIVIKKEKPLVLCDIDDTILIYNKTLKQIYNEQQIISPNASFEELTHLANDEYYMYRILNNPFHTDEDGLKKLFEKIKQLNGELIFITSRSIGSKQMTQKHFKLLGIDYEKSKIHYLSNLITKGEYIKKHINLKERGEIIFVDNLKSNIENVISFNPDITCYRFVYKNKK
jgi:hypothetical protein